MRVTKKTAVAALGGLAAAIYLAVPASAAPDNPCGQAFIPVCSFIPLLPNLDHDVDLTTDPGALNGDAGSALHPGPGGDGG